MSQVIFNSYIDLENYGATPSGVGYTVAYDLDGVLKQKDQDGVIKPISSIADLEDTLTLGNYSGTYSIVLGTSSKLTTINGPSSILLDKGMTYAVSISSTQSVKDFDTKILSPVYYSGILNYPVLDGPFVLATMSVPDLYTPTNIYVRVNMTHTYMGDIIINLVSPGGGIVSLTNQNGSNGDNLTQTTFTSDATFPQLSTSSPPYTGTFLWRASLNVGSIPYRSNATTLTQLLNNSSTVGNWILFVDDLASGDVGNLIDWSLWFESNPVVTAGTETINALDGLYVRTEKGNRESKLTLSTSTFSAYVGYSTYSTYIENTPSRFSLGHYDSVVGGNGKIKVVDSGKTYDEGGLNKAYLHLNTFGSTTSNGVANSVVVGGQYLTASRSNHVYLGNWVNVNNAYTLPNKDGLANQILTTDGNGTASWSTFSTTVPNLYQVLSAGTHSGSHSIFFDDYQGLVLGEFGSYIRSVSNPSLISLNYQNTQTIYLSANGDSATQSFVIANTQSIDINTGVLNLQLDSGNVTTTGGLGLVYTSDYTSTFVTQSLVTKKYVDEYGGKYRTHIIAYVDPNYGNDVTGEVGRPHLPYQSVAGAMIGITGSAYSGLNRGLIHLRKGNYTDVGRLENNVDYFCEKGVVFIQNGFKDFYSVDSNVYGHASFIGDDLTLVPLTIQYSSNVLFEFDTVNNNPSFGRIYGATSSVRLKGNRITTKSDSGYGLSIENSSNVTIDVSQEILAGYSTIRFLDHFGVGHIRTPYLRCNADLGNNGYLAPSSITALRTSSTQSTVVVKGDIEDVSTGYGGVPQSALSVIGGNTTVYGNVRSSKANAITIYGSEAGMLSVFGDITSEREAIRNTHLSSFETKIKNSLIKTDGLGFFTQSVYIGGPATTYIDNSTIYNGLTDSNLINAVDEMSTIAIYNSIAYSPGSQGMLVISTASDYTIGLHNVRSNKDNGDNITDLFDPSGFIYDPNLFVPKF